jgi:vacuolar-type H+-ATPase subunit H
MDRDPNKTYGTTGGSTSGSGSTGADPGFENTGAGYGTGGINAGSTGGASFGASGSTTEQAYETDGDTSRDLGDRSRDARETAKEKLGHAREVASEKLGQARTKAHELKHRFADTLDAGADRLRSRTTSGEPAYATEGAAAIATNDSAQSRVGEKVAGGMHSTADWLRENDLDSMKRGVEEQVRTNPGRSLLIAAVAGYLIGKAFRR